ncbi:MAG: hypothetical protein IJP82_01460, partial [Bacteroidaceae bacterium]|nr:hypothetical protein [Bacteroidaceae bacterium]
MPQNLYYFSLLDKKIAKRRKKFPKNFANSQSRRTFALAFQTGGTKEWFFDRLRTRQEETRH